MNKNIENTFLSIGIIFLIAGFVQQDFSLSFESGLFNLGVIFTLSGIVSVIIKKKSKPDDE